MYSKKLPQSASLIVKSKEQGEAGPVIMQSAELENDQFRLDTFSDISLEADIVLHGDEHLHKASKAACVTTRTKRKTVNFSETDTDSVEDGNKKPAAKKTIRELEDHTSHVDDNTSVVDKTDVCSVNSGGKNPTVIGNVAANNEDTSDEDVSDVIETFVIECISVGNDIISGM